VYSSLVTDLQFVAAILPAIAWPAAIVLAVVLVRRELIVLLARMQSLEFPGGRATFTTLFDVQKAVAVVAQDAQDLKSPDKDAAVRYEVTEFRAVAALASAAPKQAVIDAWGLLEYQLNVASDRLYPDQPHGWPQVSASFENWDKWPVLRPAVVELRRLRDDTVLSNEAPSAVDATRYVSVAQDLAAMVRTSFLPEADRSLESSR
jgi:hypothetical protein